MNRQKKEAGRLQDVLLTKEEIVLKNKVRDFVKNEVSTDLVKKMNRDEIGILGTAVGCAFPMPSIMGEA